MGRWGEKDWKLLIAFRRGYTNSSSELSISPSFPLNPRAETAADQVGKKVVCFSARPMVEELKQSN